MGMLASCYTVDEERNRAFSWALSGLAIGVLGLVIIFKFITIQKFINYYN